MDTLNFYQTSGTQAEIVGMKLAQAKARNMIVNTILGILTEEKKASLLKTNDEKQRND
jgi:hypothetical protein